MRYLISAIVGVIVTAGTICYAGDIIPKQYISRFAPPRNVNETFQERLQRETRDQQLRDTLRDIKYTQSQEALGMTLKDEW